MYFPYIRAKQYDLLAIREVSGLVYSDNKAMPVIEPINLTVQSLSSYRRIRVLNIPFVLIVNPQVGDLINQRAQIRNRLINDIFRDYENYTLGFIVNENVNLGDVETFLNSFQNIGKCIIHYQN